MFKSDQKANYSKISDQSNSQVEGNSKNTDSKSSKNELSFNELEEKLFREQYKLYDLVVQNGVKSKIVKRKIDILP